MIKKLLGEIQETILDSVDILNRTAMTMRSFPGATSREHDAGVIWWQGWRIRKALGGDFVSSRQEWEKVHADIPPMQESSIPDHQIETIVMEIGLERVQSVVARLQAVYTDQVASG